MAYQIMEANLHMSNWSSLYFQDPSRYVIEEFVFFHDYIIFYLILITFFVLFIILFSMVSKNLNLLLVEYDSLEIVWIIIPLIILLLIGVPSLILLYLVEEKLNWMYSLKINGHQWYWSYYENWNLEDNEFERYIERRDSTNLVRLLDTDTILSLPIFIPVRALVTSKDVIHCWTIPSLGFKADAIPGRLNQISIWLNRRGVYYGQCREICGENHRYMPVKIEVK